ncbi:MAG: MerR family transcriptional regulator [Chitinophagaceae bacterium]
MHHFTIRDVENLSGIKAHTLRIWEQRHGLCVCKRKESQHRCYDNEDLKYILRIAYLYHNGYRISRIAALSPQELTHLAAQPINKDEHEVLINQLMEAGLDYNHLQFEKTLRQVLKLMGLEKSIETVIYPFFDKIGLLWMTGHVLPAQEHFCTYLVQKLIIGAIEGLPAVDCNQPQRVLLFTPKGDMHELPLLFVQYIMKKKGIQSIMLGRNSTTEMLAYCCKHQPVTHLYFHFITNFTNGDAAAYIHDLSDQFPGLQILASGPALKTLQDFPANVRVLRSPQEVIALRLNG